MTRNIIESGSRRKMFTHFLAETRKIAPNPYPEDAQPFSSSLNTRMSRRRVLEAGLGVLLFTACGGKKRNIEKKPSTPVEQKDHEKAVSILQSFGYSSDQIQQLEKRYGDIRQYWHEVKFDDPSIPVNHVFNFLEYKSIAIKFDEEAYKKQVTAVRKLPGTTVHGLNPFDGDTSSVTATFGGPEFLFGERTIVLVSDTDPSPAGADSWIEPKYRNLLGGLTDGRTKMRSLIKPNSRELNPAYVNLFSLSEMFVRESSITIDPTDTYGPILDKYKTVKNEKGRFIDLRPAAVFEMLKNSIVSTVLELLKGSDQEEAGHKVDEIESQKRFVEFPNDAIKLRTPHEVNFSQSPFSGMVASAFNP